jgi:hypothetical protein
LITSIEAEFAQRFKMKLLGPLAWFLGIRISWEAGSGRLTMTQEAYITKVLLLTHVDPKAMGIPMDPNMKLSKVQGPQTISSRKTIDTRPYRKFIGILMYLSCSIRPDIAFATGLLARFSENPGELHWKALQRLLQYLNHTKALGISFTVSVQLHRRSTDASSPPLAIIGYSDSDYAGCVDERKSTTGYVFYMANGPICWSSKKQACVAMSSTEAEYIAMSSAVTELAWLRRLLAFVLRKSYDGSG